MPLQIWRVIISGGDDGVYEEFIDNEDFVGADEDDVDANEGSDDDVSGFYEDANDDDGGDDDGGDDDDDNYDDDIDDNDVDHVEQQRIQRRGSLSRKLLRRQLPGEPLKHHCDIYGGGDGGGGDGGGVDGGERGGGGDGGDGGGGERGDIESLNNFAFNEILTKRRSMSGREQGWDGTSCCSL